MLKKFSYLATVSVLATTVMAQTVYGMEVVPDDKTVATVSRKVAAFQDHNGVQEVIKEFYNPSPQLIITNKDSQEELELSTPLWIVSGAYSMGSTILSPLAKPTGNLLRWAGDQIRDDSFVGDLLVDNAIQMGKNVNVVGNMAANVTGKIENNEGILQSIRCTTGNILRGTGEKLAGETPTLARALRKFWIENKYAEKPEDVLTSTACALYLSSYINGVDHITQSYNDFLKSWNNSSYTVHSLDPGVNQEYFIRGITKAYVIKKLPVDEKFTQQILTLGCNLETLPATKLITSETVLKTNPKLEANALEETIKAERKTKLLEYAKDVYEYETLKNLANAERQKVITQAPRSIMNAEPVGIAPKINPLTNDLGQSLIGWKDESNDMKKID